MSTVAVFLSGSEKYAVFSSESDFLEWHDLMLNNFEYKSWPYLRVILPENFDPTEHVYLGVYGEIHPNTIEMLRL